MKSKFDELLKEKVESFGDSTKEYIINEGLFGNIFRGIGNFLKNKVKNVWNDYKERVKSDFATKDEQDSGETESDILSKIGESLNNLEVQSKTINFKFKDAELKNVSINKGNLAKIKEQLTANRFDRSFVTRSLLSVSRKPVNISQENLQKLLSYNFGNVIRNFSSDKLKKYFDDNSKNTINMIKSILSVTKPSSQSEIVSKLILVFIFADKNATFEI